MDWTISSRNDVFDKLAYTVGFFLGDGCVTSYPFKSSKNGKTYHKNDVVFGKPDVECLERVQGQIETCFGKRYPIRGRKLKSGSQYYEYSCYRRDIFDFFAVNTAMRSEIPQYYFSAPKRVQKELAIGLMDSDGHVAEFNDGDVKRWMLGFSNTNISLVESLASILQKMNVKVGKISEGKKAGYKTCYIIHPNPRTFIEAGFYFYSARKQEKLARYHQHVVGSETQLTAPLTQGEDIVRLCAKA